MAHDRLFPKAGFPFLAPTAVVDLLKREFNVVQVDVQEGRLHVEKLVEQLRRLQHLQSPPASEDEIERLEKSREESLYVVVADEHDHGPAYLKTYLIPAQPVFFGYSSRQHEQASRPLLARFASCLGYEVEFS
ncbi:MAG TPA: hypothetical protein VH370_23995 [Humisphaera sp.]|jgi:hypothetical protein|nr:hypothetical protein [Humisphaera sp.]